MERKGPLQRNGQKVIGFGKSLPTKSKSASSRPTPKKEGPSQKSKEANKSSEISLKHMTPINVIE